MKEVGIHGRVQHMQKIALLEMARILRSVLGFYLHGSRTYEFIGIWLTNSISINDMSIP